MKHEIECPRCGEMVEYEPGDTDVTCQECGNLVLVVNDDEG